MLIKICFKDFWDGLWDYNSNVFTDILTKYNINYVIDDVDPDIVIYSVFGNNNLKYNCKKLLFTGEPSKTTFNPSYCITETFAPCISQKINSDYAIGFEYHADSRYLRFPLYSFFSLTYKHYNILEPVNTHTKFCAIGVSNINLHKLDVINLVKSYKPIDMIVNPCSINFIQNNCNINPIPDNRIPDTFTGKINILKDYKFALALENCNFDGYITEKIIDVIRAGAIPIYRGTDKISNDFNTECFINYNDFESGNNLINLISSIDNDSDLLNQYLINIKHCRKFSDEYFQEQFINYFLKIMI
jgi:hypothetical protein